MEFVLRQGSGVDERLANVFFFQIRKVLDDLRGRHAVGNEVEHVRDRDAKAADGGSPGQDIGVLRDPIECIRHGLSLKPILRPQDL